MRLRSLLLFGIVAFAAVGCSRRRESAAPEEPAAGVADASASAAASDASMSAPAPPSAPGGYPVGRACTPAAIAVEKGALPPASQWPMLTSTVERIRLRIPPGAFYRTQEAFEGGLRLTSRQKARGLGPHARDRPFELRVRRTSLSVDALLADTSVGSPLEGAHLDDAFPKPAPNFGAYGDEPKGSGAAVHTTIGAKPAWIWTQGVEGYNSDYILIELGAKDTVVVVADWNSSIMVGQPECWQRAVIGGVVESIEAEVTSSPIQTIAGELEVASVAGFEAYELRLAGKPIVRADSRDPNDKRSGAPIPSIVRSFGRLGAYDEVLLVRWDGMGNACNGYEFDFLQLMRDGTATLSDPVPWCGGPPPIITTSGPVVTITSPKHPPNRGTGVIFEESFIYQAGRVTKR